MDEIQWYIYDPIKIHDWYLQYVIRNNVPAAFTDLIESIERSTCGDDKESDDQFFQAKTRLLDLLKDIHFGTLIPHQINILNTLKYGNIFGPIGYGKIRDGIEISQNNSSKIIEYLRMYKEGILVLFHKLRSAKDESEKKLFRTGDLIGVNQYKKAIASLNDSDLEFLKELYYLYPVKDHYDLAERLHYKNVGGVNLQIGKLSNEIIRILNFKNRFLLSRTGIATNGFFSAVHKIELARNLPNSDKWIMEPNLMLALEELKLVRPIHF